MSNILLMGLALACLAATFLHLESVQLRRQTELRAESTAGLAAATAAPLISAGDRAGLDRAAGAIMAAADAAYLVVTGPSGQVLVSASRSGQDAARLPGPAPTDSPSPVVSRPGGEPTLEVQHSIRSGNTWLGLVRVGLSLAPERNMLSSHFGYVAGAALLALLLLNLTQHLQLRKLLDPIADLVQTATQAARGESVEQIHNRRADEIGQLGRALNELAVQLRSRRELALSLHRAQEANRVQGEFLAKVSHQLRTPMNGIIGMTELALATKVTGEQREYLENVASSSESLLHLLDDILDFSRIVAGKLELDPKPFSLRDLIGHTVRALAVRAHQKGLELMWDIEENVPDHLVGDSTRLRQVVVNLVGNAVKFTRHGEILVRVQLKERAAEEICLLFQVRDTGPGVPREKQDAIFGAFARAGEFSQRMGGGSGLGLAICSRLVHLMRGEIGVESEPGRGSTFHFTAAFAQARPAAVVSPRELAEPLRGITVLIFDDNRTNVRILDRVLTNWGCQTFRAGSAEGALRAVRAAREAGTPFRVILVDATMPGRSAFVLAAGLKAGAGQSESVIMMLSSTNLPGDVARCHSLGINRYLTKPVSHAALRAEICGAVEQAIPTATAVPAARLSILVAEDNLVNQRLAVRLLERKGYLVATASNGREAIEASEKTHFDLILMDVQMPEMDGLATTAAIRERERFTGVHVPILASTAHAMGGDRERCLQSGMDGYVSKPFKAEALYAAVEEVVHRVSTMPPSKTGEYRRPTNTWRL